MRLTHDQIQAIKQTAHAVLGNDSRGILFGSRADDTKKGGDIDLLFEADHAVGNRATTRSGHSMFRWYASLAIGK